MLMPTDRDAIINRCNELDPLITAGRVKNGQTYLFRFRLSQCNEALRSIGHLAGSQDSDFSWYDAALVSKQIRELRDAIEDGLKLPDESES